MSLRLEKFFLKNHGVDALLLNNGDVTDLGDPNFFYYSGLRVDSSILLASKDEGERILFTPKMHVEHAKFLSEQSGFDCTVVDYKGKEFLKKFSAEVKKMGLKRIGFNSYALTSRSYLSLMRILRKAKLVDVGSKMLEQRMVKDEMEIGLIKNAVKSGKKILDEIENEVKVGKRESEIAAKLKIKTIEMGFEPAFAPIVASGKNGAFPHAVPSAKKLARDEAVTIDYGVRANDYCSDLTRCYFLGNCKKQKEDYEKLQEITGEIAKKAGRLKKFSQVTELANKLMKENKLPELPHSIGHGIGLEVHEYPGIRKNSEHRLASGNVFTIEPGVYYAGNYGLRYEETVLLKDGKVLIL
ncbi:Xaa-Pro dipeptidase [Candidatus Gugararchaeum adminiculabundum]|nr:Xaa-Pro dipeptidase [Candidatus Gugararchaeum adminiculabundum]